MNNGGWRFPLAVTFYSRALLRMYYIKYIFFYSFSPQAPPLPPAVLSITKTAITTTTCTSFCPNLLLLLLAIPPTLPTLLTESLPHSLTPSLSCTLYPLLRLYRFPRSTFCCSKSIPRAAFSFTADFVFSFSIKHHCTLMLSSLYTAITIYGRHSNHHHRTYDHLHHCHYTQGPSPSPYTTIITKATAVSTVSATISITSHCCYLHYSANTICPK